VWVHTHPFANVWICVRMCVYVCVYVCGSRLPPHLRRHEVEHEFLGVHQRVVDAVDDQALDELWVVVVGAHTEARTRNRESTYARTTRRHGHMRVSTQEEEDQHTAARSTVRRWLMLRSPREPSPPSRGTHACVMRFSRRFLFL
jgi:hypothetical protein